jgi:hypothetical protein
MSESKHTPGNWFVDDDERPYTVSTDHGQEICRCLCYDDFPCLEEDDAADVNAESLANARLIAAAPELLDSIDPETLEAIADEIDCFEHSARAAGLRGLAKRQRAARAKATGQSDV